MVVKLFENKKPPHFWGGKEDSRLFLLLTENLFLSQENNDLLHPACDNNSSRSKAEADIHVGRHI